MAAIVVTLLVSQLPTSWLNDSAPENTSCMSVTLLVSQAPMSWLNEEASWNRPCMSVTLLVSHPPMSWLKVEARLNASLSVVTLAGNADGTTARFDARRNAPSRLVNSNSPQESRLVIFGALPQPAHPSPKRGSPVSRPPTLIL